MPTCSIRIYVSAFPLCFGYPGSLCECILTAIIVLPASYGSHFGKEIYDWGFKTVSVMITDIEQVLMKYQGPSEVLRWPAIRLAAVSIFSTVAVPSVLADVLSNFMQRQRPWRKLGNQLHVSFVLIYLHKVITHLRCWIKPPASDLDGAPFLHPPDLF